MSHNGPKPKQKGFSLVQENFLYMRTGKQQSRLFREVLQLLSLEDFWARPDKPLETLPGLRADLADPEVGL